MEDKIFIRLNNILALSQLLTAIRLEETTEQSIRELGAIIYEFTLEIKNDLLKMGV